MNRAALLLCVVLAACHREHRDEPIVRKLEIEGASALSPGDISKRILTTQTSWVPFSRKSYFDANVWRTDLRRIERYYNERGFFQAAVVEEEVKPDGNGGVHVRVRVDEGKPTVVTKLDVTGLEVLDEKTREELMETVGFKPGDLFVEDRWEGLKSSIESQLHEMGYAEAKASGKATVDLDKREALIPLHVEVGPRYRFGGVEVTPAPGGRVEAWRVAEQVKEAVEDEDWYSETGRAEAQARVFNMGVFGGAKVSRGAGETETGLVPLKVELQEAPFHEIKAGGGIGFEPARNDLHAIGEYTHRDFLAGLRRLQLQARAGWAFIPSAYAVGRASEDVLSRHGPIARLLADLQQPRLFHPNFRGQARVELERDLEPAYSYIGGRLKLGVPWQPWTWFTIRPSYNLEVYRLQVGEARLTTDIPPVLFGCPTSTCVLSYLEQTAEMDRRDDRLEPRSGYYLALSLQEGGGPFGGTFSYFRITPEVRGYVSILEDRSLTFGARLKLGTLIPTTGDETATPIVARFFSGGDRMRGFGTKRLAPMFLAERDTSSGPAVEPLPVGGNGLVEAGAEVRYHFANGLSLATFVDTGVVTVERLAVGDLGSYPAQLLLAVGGGVRYRTPVGPVRLDFAYRPDIGRPLPLYPLGDSTLGYPSGQGCFGFGSRSATSAGAPEGPCAIHLSIGEAF